MGYFTMGSKRRSFSKEFKLNAVKLYLEGQNGGCKVLSKSLGLNDHRMLMRWVEKYKVQGEAGLEDMRGKIKSPFRGHPRTVSVTLEDENLRLRAENEYLRRLLELNQDNIKKKHNI